MARLTDRQEARARLMAAFNAQLDKLIPADEAKPLKGGLFVEWEDQAEELARTLHCTFLEERASLEDSAQVDEPGRCPHCGSTRIYLIKGVRRAEVRTPLGPVVLDKQRARCRSCDRTFSPSGPRVGPDRGGRPEPEGGPARGA